MSGKYASDMHRLRLKQDWLDARDTARELGVQPNHLAESIRPLIAHTSRSLTGARTARGVGYAYARSDVKRVQRIMRALGCKALKAAQILHAARELNRRNMLEAMLEEASELRQRLDSTTTERNAL